jgi:hypothetical protein
MEATHCQIKTVTVKPGKPDIAEGAFVTLRQGRVVAQSAAGSYYRAVSPGCWKPISILEYVRAIR